MFYDPACPHCRKFFLEYVQIADAYALLWKENPNEVFPEVFAVNCMKQKKTCDWFKVITFPTLVVLYKGKLYPYEGKLEAKEAREWIDEDFQYQSL